MLGQVHFAIVMHHHTLQHPATHLQHTCNTLQHTAREHWYFGAWMYRHTTYNIQANITTRIYAHAHAHAYAHAQVHAHTHTHTHTHTNTHTYTSTHIHIHRHTHRHTYIEVRAGECVYIYITSYANLSGSNIVILGAATAIFVPVHAYVHT